MEFSVLMSVYKGDNASYLSKAIASVTVKQSLKPSQLVLVKDGPVSDDIEREIDNWKERLGDIEFTVVEKEKNEGLAAALNMGLRYCKHRLVARMDADDISLANRFEVQIRYIDEHPEISILGGAISEFDEDESDIMQIRQTPTEHSEIVKMAKTRNPMNHVTVVFKKQDIEKLGGYCESFGKLEDYKLWVDAISEGKLLHNISDVVVNVRIGDGFIKRRSNKREIQDWDMLQKYLLDARLIGIFKAIINKIYIRAFIYMPSGLKKLAYKLILRK